MAELRSALCRADMMLAAAGVFRIQVLVLACSVCCSGSYCLCGRSCRMKIDVLVEL
jgi:hypothetical protein